MIKLEVFTLNIEKYMSTFFHKKEAVS